MQEATGSRNEGEVYRYIMLPGQAVSYYVGFQKILEMRQRAMNVLGSKFNLKEFHHVLLSNGQLPLSFLEQLVDAYLEQKSQ
jgi:uncharacterized protein (DUF885 family)